MKKKKLLSIVAVVCTAAALFAGCGKKEVKPDFIPVSSSEDEISEEVSEPVSEPAPEPEPDPHEGEARSFLTGEWIDPELAAQRPVAVMVSNNHSSLPIYGLNDADVIYQATMAGEETRFMMVFQDYVKVPVMMPIRSCRHYFLFWALGMDAIYSHYGQSYLAEDELATSYVDNLNGLEGHLANVTYFRDKSRRAPQNAYATGESILAGIEQKGYRTTHEEDFKSGFHFNEDDEHEVELTGENVQDAKVFVPGYYSSRNWFVYNEETGLYDAFEWGDELEDGNDGEQVAVKNIILMLCHHRVVDSHGYLDIDMIGTGDGYYLTNGKAIPITWSKEGKLSPTYYYYEDGTEVALNQGRTWVAQQEIDNMDRMHFYASEDEFPGVS